MDIAMLSAPHGPMHHLPCITSRAAGKVWLKKPQGVNRTTAPLRRSSLRQHKEATGRLMDAYVDCTCSAGLHMQCSTFHYHAQSTYVSI